MKPPIAPVATAPWLLLALAMASPAWAEGASEPALARELLVGSFAVAQTRTASDTPSTIEDQQAANRYLGQAAAFAIAARWRDGTACAAWDLSPKLQEAPVDRSLQDLLADPPQIGWADIVCDGETLERIFFVDGDTFLSRTPNGVSWLVWRREAPPAP